MRSRRKKLFFSLFLFFSKENLSQETDTYRQRKREEVESEQREVARVEMNFFVSVSYLSSFSYVFQRWAKSVKKRVEKRYIVVIIIICFGLVELVFLVDGGSSSVNPSIHQSDHYRSSVVKSFALGKSHRHHHHTSSVASNLYVMWIHTFKYVCRPSLLFIQPTIMTTKHSFFIQLDSKTLFLPGMCNVWCYTNIIRFTVKRALMSSSSS